jgi:two-component system, OmpR family, flagellar system response regulator FtcR
MIVVVDERNLVLEGYTSLFRREGFTSAGFCTDKFQDWFDNASEADLKSVGACLIGNVQLGKFSPSNLRKKTGAPVIALVEQGSLEQTLQLFDAGVDDVLKKPVHVREILKRISVIGQRYKPAPMSGDAHCRVKIFFDGRDVEIDGRVFPLPRRERRILEYLASVGGRRVDKGQIFSAVYSVFDDAVDESVLDSHISKLRKKLRAALGYDPVDSQRFLGYRLVLRP